MKANVFSITEDHYNNKGNKKETCKDPLSGRKHFEYFYAKLTF